MKRVNIVNLVPAKKLSSTLCHESGEVLKKVGEPLTQEEIDFMKQCGINVIYEIENAKELTLHQQTASFRNIRVSDLKEGEKLASPIYSTNRILLIQAGVEITNQIKKGLLKRGIYDCYIKKTPKELKLEQVYLFRKLREGEKTEPQQTPNTDKLLEEVESLLKSGSSESPGERRRHQRYKIGTMINFQVQRFNSEDWEINPAIGVVKDISQSGICIQTKYKMNIGDKVRFIVTPGSGVIELDSVAEVVRVSQINDLFEIGAYFLFIGAKKK